MVKLLLDNGAEISQDDSRRKGVLHHVTNSIHCTTSLVELLLLKGAPKDSADMENMIPLHYSIKFGHRGIAELLLNAGIPIDVGIHRKMWQRSPCGDYAVDQGIAPNPMADISYTSAGLKPLHFAALIGNPAMTKFLLQRGTDPNSLSEHNETPLHLTLSKALHETKYEHDWDGPYWRVEHL